jgi:hypothetical protein
VGGQPVSNDLHTLVDVLDDGDVHVLVEVGHELLHSIQ